jgi:hypothetical protein
MKRNFLRVLLIIFSILVIIGFVDYRLSTHSFKKPIFAQSNSSYDDGGSGIYRGIGYRIEINGNFMPDDEFKGVTHTRFYILGKEICYIVRD